MNYFVFVRKGLGILLLFVLMILVLQKTGILQGYTREAWTGLAISFLNFLAGTAIVSWGFAKEDKKFMGSFFGGMIFRLLIIFFVLFILVHYLNFNKLILVITLLVSYFSYLVLEIFVLNQLAGLRGKHL